MRPADSRSPPELRLRVVAPAFLAPLLANAQPSGAALDVIAWDHGPLPSEAARPDLFVPWVTDRTATRRALSQLPESAWVCSISSGVDWFIDSVPDDVMVTGGQGLRSQECAEWVVAVTLYLLRGLDSFTERQRTHRWDPASFGTLRDATVLLLGHGAIGTAVEARMRPFGCRFLRVAARARPGVHGVAMLSALVGQADVIVIAVPLTEATIGLVGRDLLAAMRPGTVLVNVARGPIVDQQALIAALRRRHIRAAIDVTHPEPPSADDELFNAPGLLITPHVAGVTPGFTGRAHSFVIDQIERRVQGRPLLNVVRLGVLARAGKNGKQC